MKNKETAKIIGENLKKIRTESLNMTQKEFSDYLNMSVQNLSQTERGVYKPGLDKLMEISDILKVTPNDLLLESESVAFFNSKEKELKKDISSISVLMETWEPYRAKAELAKQKGNNEEEIAAYKTLINHLVWLPKHWEKVADFVYYERINEEIQKISNGYKQIYTNPSYREKFKKILESLL